LLRLEFSPADLGRVRIASAPHPLWELALAINSFQAPDLPARYREWRRDVVRRRHEQGELCRLLTAAATVIPANGNFPDSFTPSVGDRDVEAHFDSILAVPRYRFREDLDRTFPSRTPVPCWARNLYRHGRADGIVDVLRRTNAVLVRPVDRLGTQDVEACRASYARLLLDGGTERLLTDLHPSIHWRNPVLEADYPAERTIRLDGRGLLVIPARFCWGAPVTLLDADRSPVLVVPAETGYAEADLAPTAADDRLEKLLGPTRARLLGELTVGGSTSELAARLHVSQAAVSQHTKVLREAGLIATTRIGASVRHALTSLGHELSGT
jgi:DNA-binding transcriptional ArsR family regulator